MNALRTAFDLLKQTFTEWNEDNVPRLAAALAYYIAFAIAPLLVITIAVVGFVLQETYVREEVLALINNTMGSSAREFINSLIDSAREPTTGIISTILGIGALLFGAAGAFEQLKNALNTVWNVPDSAREEGVRGFILTKVLSFGMLLLFSFLLLVSLVLSTALSAFESYTLSLLPSAEVILRILNQLFSFGVVVLLFAMIYRFLPDLTLKWRDVWFGAVITALLFTIGKFLLGLYLGQSGTESTYGAAGSFVLILLWIYYSAQIVLFGAEFTQVYARRYGPARHQSLPPKKSARAEKPLVAQGAE